MSWTMMRIHHPLHGLDPEVSPTARFTGYPPVSAPTGVVVTDDQTHRFMTVLDGFPHNRWHQDINWTMGVPGVDAGVIYTGVGGAGATRSIMAVDAGTGAPRWVYAPEGLSPDPQRVQIIEVPKTITVLKNDPRIARLRERASTGQVAGFGTRASVPLVETTTKQIPVNVPQPNSVLPPGHLTNPGLVISNGRIYGEVNRSIVALDQRTGSPVWRHQLTERAVVHSLVATPDHLLFCMSNTHQGERLAPWEVRGEDQTEDFLVAVRLDNGKRVWKEPVPFPGTLSLSNGLVYFANGDLHVLGPAERTYDLALNSDEPEDYRTRTREQLASVPAECLPQADQPEGAEAEAPARVIPAKASASVLRLEYGRPVAELVRQVRARRGAIGQAPLLISLDWLTPDRSAVRGSSAGAALNPAWVREFGTVVEQLAVEGRPEHFDVAPEVNVYLARYPGQLEMVRALVRNAAAMVRDGAPYAKVLVSYNLETLAGLYGRNTVRPFGSFQKLLREDALASLTLLRDVVEAGITRYPQSAFLTPDLIPADYLLSVKPYLQQKPLLLTGATVRIDGKSPREVATQAGFLPRLQQQAYWLDAKVVVPPDVLTSPAPAWPKNAKGQPLDVLGAAMAGWEALPRWERVTRLSVAQPEQAAPARTTAPY
ncbi:MAG: hypothetical protein ACO1SX_11315 [Actinomycetota bacterium]